MSSRVALAPPPPPPGLCSDDVVPTVALVVVVVVVVEGRQRPVKGRYNGPKEHCYATHIDHGDQYAHCKPGIHKAAP